MTLVLRWLPLLALLIANGAAERWQFPDAAESVRIDSKVRFTDSEKGDTNSRLRDEKQADDVPFQVPSDTEGFYNRPPGSGRYPVRVEENSDENYNVIGKLTNRDHSREVSSATSQFCKCSATADCSVQKDVSNRCGADHYLCCYNFPRKQRLTNTETFNEVDDERLIRYPGQTNMAGPFPPPPIQDSYGVFGTGYGHENVLLGSLKNRGPSIPANANILSGPNGPTGIIGPNKPVLVGPDGPTGIVGPTGQRLFGPLKDINQSETAQRGVLIGPSGPTRVIGPAFNRGTSTYTHPVLVGPGRQTGSRGFRRQGVLVGPEGPTGIIGPNYGRQPGPGVLVGPGGPTGIIGPGRPILTGPGGPTGIIGPRGGYGK